MLWTQASLEETDTVVKKVPKGTSDYQATWIVDSDGGESDDDDKDDDDTEEEEEDAEMAPKDVDTEEDDAVSVAKTDNMQSETVGFMGSVILSISCFSMTSVYRIK